MDCFAVANSNFEFVKAQSEQDAIKHAFASSLDTPTSPFSMPDGMALDYTPFVAEPKTETSPHLVSKADEDQPMPSIEHTDEPMEHAVEGQEDANVSSKNGTHHTQETQAGDKSLVRMEDNNGLKNDSADPLLFAFDGLDDFFANGDNSMQIMDSFGSMPTLASPLQIADNGALQMQKDKPHAITSLEQFDASHLIPPFFPTGRRRSQTAPPEFDIGVHFQRRVNSNMPVRNIRQMNGHIPHATGPMNMMNTNHRGRRIDGRFVRDPHMMGMPRSYPITPPLRHPHPMAPMPNDMYMTHPRPQSLNPDIRMNLSNRMRDISPDRGRRVKRQKQSHERAMPLGMLLPSCMPQDGDGAAFGVDQTVAAVEFLLRGTMEKAKYGRDEEVERARTDTRVLNAAITSLDMPLVTMASGKPPATDVVLPRNGAEIKELNTQGIHALLHYYDIPYVSTMFLHDKKLLYLNFLGASGSLKHLVLD